MLCAGFPTVSSPTETIGILIHPGHSAPLPFKSSVTFSFTLRIRAKPSPRASCDLTLLDLTTSPSSTRPSVRLLQPCWLLCCSWKVKSQLISFPVQGPCAYCPLPGIFFPWIIPWLAPSFVKASLIKYQLSREAHLWKVIPLSLYVPLFCFIFSPDACHYLAIGLPIAI